MIAIYSGTSAPRAYVDEPPREPTRQFRAPVFDHAADEFRARLVLAFKHRNRSEFAQARLRTVLRIFRDGAPGNPARLIIAAFDAQNREALGLEGL